MAQSPASWYPVARTEEVIARHVVQAQLLGQELAIWRDDAGFVNVWENRCLHRGVRLSIGMNTGHELRCQYHGWRYASMTGRCTFIPAHPDRPPPAAIRAVSFGGTERYGYVWVNLSDEACRSPMPSFAGDSFMTCRSIHVDEACSRVAEFIAARHLANFVDAERLTAELVLDSPHLGGTGQLPITLLMQPMSGAQTVIHGMLNLRIDGEQRLAMLQRYDRRLSALRDVIERASGRSPGPSDAVAERSR